MVEPGSFHQIEGYTLHLFPRIPSRMSQGYSKVPLEYLLIAISLSFWFAQVFLFLVSGLINKHFGIPLNICVCVCVCVFMGGGEREWGGVQIHWHDFVSC